MKRKKYFGREDEKKEMLKKKRYKERNTLEEKIKRKKYFRREDKKKEIL